MKKIIVTVLLVICFSTNAKNIFVNQGSKASAQNKNGLTLSAAFTNLQPAIDAAVDGDVIFVQSNPPSLGNSSGYVYVPTDFPPGSDTSDPRNRAFHTDGKKLAILGGLSNFNYIGSAPTILSGDFNQDDDPLVVGSNSENAYHVFVLDNVDETFRFDRIEFRDGNANGISSFDLSGQLDQTVSQNQGAGLYTVNASPLLIATLFSGNHADANGAALYNHNSSPQLFNSVFNDNKADGNGAGIYNDATSAPQIINNTFIRNDAIGDGGGLFNQSATPVLVSNTVFYDNTAINGSDIGGVSLDASSIHNASDSNGGGIASGVGFVDLSATPASEIFEDILNPEINYFGEFVDGFGVFTATSGFVPVVDSPLLNAGLNSENSLLTAPFLYPSVFVDDENTQILDPLAHPRVKVCKIDIGAFEASEIMIHVDSAAPDNTGGGGSWDTALRDLQVGIDCATEDDTVILAQGVYKPTESPDEISTDPRDRAFHINKTISVKGGFDPTTGIQDFNTPSILSGDFLGDDVITGSGETLVFTGIDENATHVMIVVAPQTGFANVNYSNFENLNIQGGNATINGGSINYSGFIIRNDLAGGIFFRDTRSHLNNMIIKHNSASSAAGGIWSEHNINVLTDIQFISNQVTGEPGFIGGGAGYFTASGDDTLTNVVFWGNLAERGAGMALNTGRVTLTNVLFYKNHSIGDGGGLWLKNAGGGYFLINVSFIQNSSANAIDSSGLKGGGGLYQYEFNPVLIQPVLRNTVFFGNTATVGNDDLDFSFSNSNSTARVFLDSTSSHNASDGTGEGIDTTANFTDLSGALANDVFTDINDPDGADDKFGTADDGLVPISISPLVDSGDNTVNPTALDLANIPRVYQTTIDKGAYESQYISILQGKRVTVNLIENGLTQPFVLDLDSDNPNNGTLVWSILDQGSKGVASVMPVNGSGMNVSVNYSQNNNTFGVDDFTVQVTDGSYTGSILVNVVLNPKSATPMSQTLSGPDSFSCPQDNTLTLQGSQTGFDYYLLNNDTFSIVDGVSGTGGSLNFQSGVINQSNSFQVLAATPSYALDFDGIDDRVEIPHDSSLNFSSGLTIEAWVNVSAFTTDGANTIFRKENSTQGRLLFRFTTDAMGQSFLNVGLHTVGSGYQEFSAPINQADFIGKWVNVAAYFDDASNAIRLFKDGNELLSGLAANGALLPVTSPSVAYIGAYNGVAELFKGKIAALRLWNIGLLGNELQASINNVFAGNEAGLVAYYPFFENSGNLLVDATNNDNHGTILGFTQWVAGTNGGVGQSISNTHTINLDNSIIYVDKNVLGGDGSGCSWANAMTSITPAIASSIIGGEVHIAEGLYQEGAQLNLTQSISLIGGFPTGGGVQDIIQFETIIDGNDTHRVINSSTNGGLNIVLDGLTITHGYDLNFGGGVYFATFNQVNNLSITRCKVRQNISNRQGGGVYIGNATLTIDKTVISGNSTFSLNLFTKSEGGGIYIISGIVDIKDSEITNNKSGTDLFTTESYGGGIYSAGSELTIINTLINNNLLRYTIAGFNLHAEGAGIYNNSGNAIIINSYIKANSIVANGTNSTENVKGVGIYSSFGTLKLINSYVTENSLPNLIGNGIGIYALSNNLSLINSNVIENLAFANTIGGGIYMDFSQLLLNNSIVANNLAVTDNEIHLANGATQVVNNSYIKDQNPLGNNNIDSTVIGFNPGFVSATDFHLQSDSILADAGDNSLLPTDDFDLDNDGDIMEALPIDLDGNQRISGNFVDIGAYEFITQYNLDITVTGLAATNSISFANALTDTLVFNTDATQTLSTLDDGSTFDVSITSAQPDSPNQICVFIGSNSGTINGANTNISVICTTQKYNVNVTVTGLAIGNSVDLANGGDSLTVSDGSVHTISTLNDESGYAVSVTINPTTPNQVCNVTSGTGTLAGTDVNVSINCTTTQYNIGVTVSGLATNNSVILQNNGGDDLTVSDGLLNNFATQLDDETAYLITVLTNPAMPNQTCMVDAANTSGTINSTSVIIGVVCTTDTFNVNVFVSGLAADNTINVSNNGITNILSDTVIQTSFNLDDGSSYSVTTTNPTTPNQVCVVTGGDNSDGSGVINGNDVSIIITCSINQYFIGGSVIGLVTGNSVNLSINTGTELLTVNGNIFSFVNPLADQSSYSITIENDPTNPNQSCSIQNPTGTINGSDINNVVITCVTNSYFIGGQVIGLLAGNPNTLVLQNNNADDLVIYSDGSFVFATALLDLFGYSVTILSQPNNPMQTCAIVLGVGFVAGDDVVDIQINCEVGDDFIYANGFE